MSTSFILRAFIWEKEWRETKKKKNNFTLAHKTPLSHPKSFCFSLCSYMKVGIGVDWFGFLTGKTDQGRKIDNGKDSWSWSSNTSATWYKEPTHWKRPWCWERWKAKGEESGKGWDCIINSVDMSLTLIWEIAKDREAWRTIVHGVTESDTTWQLNKNRDR